MDKEQIRQLVQEEINKRMSETDTVNQFALSQTSFHTHNGVDSQKIPFTNLSDTPVSYSGSAGKSVVVNSAENGLEFGTSGGAVYAGRVTTVGTATVLPSGWTSTYLGGNTYEITHNLGIAITEYVVVASSQNVDRIVFPTGYATNTFNVLTYSYPGALSSPADFTFILCVNS